MSFDISRGSMRAAFALMLVTSSYSGFAGKGYAPHPDVSGGDILARCEKSLKNVQEKKEKLRAPRAYHGGAKALKAYNEILIIVGDTLSEASLISQVHPDEKIRKDAEQCEQKASKFSTELSLDNAIYQAVLATNKNVLNLRGKRVLENTLRDFRRAGVDKDEATRDKIKALKEELVAVGQEFGQNISNDRFSIELDSAAALEGLPDDYIQSHLQASGKYVVDTTYPDYVPFMKYAKNDDARRKLRFKYLNRGEKNGPVLESMIKKRYELAQLLGYRSYADYIVEDKMIKNAGAIHSFIEKISGIAQAGADREFQALLNYKQLTNSRATTIEGHESSFLEEAYKKEKFGFDSQEVRAYFPYKQVRDGLLQFTSDFFGISYKKVTDAKTWHESVDVYDVYDNKTGKLGRIYLDMHPREGKFSHAAQFTVRSGYNNRQYPEGALVCNFPNPADGDGFALLEHSDVTTFFHEFGHLMHHVFAGKQKWASFSGVATEWDFVEAPSQLLEEWAWSPDVLAKFARHYKTGEVISAELVAKMRAAEEFGKAIGVRQQMFYASLSANYYDRDPSSFDPDTLLQELQTKYSYYPYEEGTHFNHNFGHLEGYSAMYYTYMWSLSLAKDLFEPFKEHGLLNAKIAKRYRRLVLTPGGSKDASTLVEDFLGRPFQFDAFEKWLTADAAPTLTH